MSRGVVRTTDPARFGRVAVLLGGTSSEREVSLNSGANVLDALRARGVDAFPVDGIPALIDLLVQRGVDRVFNILHGSAGGGEDGVLQGLLDAYRVPYTGSGVLGTALAMDKVRSKQIWLALGLPTPRYVRLTRGGDVHAAVRALGLPVIVKPSCEGSSVGVTRVFDASELDAAAALAARYPGELLVEELIRGQGEDAGEYTVAVLDGVALPSIRIVPAGEYYDYHAKYVAEDTRYLCPGLDGEAEAEMGALALAAFEALGCSGWGRVDVMRDGQGRNFLLEVNTAPGMTSHSLVPKSARQVGIDFDALCWHILETSLAGGEGA
ncbi:MAG: D-alanine--D-alanine ligase [Chiayiivirga sp.]|jgi:D-alanine-D-alanine ligase|uniref:D-alanine--D-alanine ligase n=1 Tax=Denitratimonas tolerans TaxID=1338420 RepID=A0AAW9QSF9_9GAMM|nr:D-alanine--D-alanine ligase [Xanthomonadaceae bacterium]MDX9764083.1 D-alanine--D-alanine ligase [Chiayiivirga sp.]HRQ34241.1 D-alanine--D-alanine ligase [Chiayiivirga sp.]